MTRWEYSMAVHQEGSNANILRVVAVRRFEKEGSQQ